MAHFDYYLTADTKEAILADLRSKEDGSGKRPWRWFLYLLGTLD